MTEENQQQYAMKLRPRRAVLSDISNTITQQLSSFTTMAKRINKKRRLSAEEGEEGPADQSEIVDLTDNPINCSSNIITTVDKSNVENMYGYNPPKKIQRKLPLQIRAADPSLCLNLIDDMYAMYTEIQNDHRPHAYFHKQFEVTCRMRTILIDWIVEIHYKYKLHPATLWLTVNILDRYLEKNNITRNRLQLLGITSLFVACKFEEVHAPEVKDCIYLVDSAYTRVDILEMERSILSSLEYNLFVPTPYHFLTRFLLRIRATDKLKFTAFYAAERNLQEPEILDYPPKTIAAASVYIAIKTVFMDEPGHLECWTPALVEESDMQKEDFAECAAMMLEHINEIPVASTRRKLDAARKKYGSRAMFYITEQPFPDEI